MKRWKCICAYDGTGFSGWQSQPRGDAVQDSIEARLAEIAGVKTRIHGSGRTDAGVHALGQVFHFDAAWKHGADRLTAALQHGLPPSIQIVSTKAVPVDFHARFSATGKVYEYHLRKGGADPFTRAFVWAIPRPLDTARMRAAARVLVGRRDFKAFSAFNGEEPGEAADTVRDLRRLDVIERGRAIKVVAQADGFLYKMVRTLVGALVAAGEGKMTPEEISGYLETGVRTARIQTCPPHGLFLKRVLYR